jgi:hypothetical protein
VNFPRQSGEKYCRPTGHQLSPTTIITTAIIIIIIIIAVIIVITVHIIITTITVVVVVAIAASVVNLLLPLLSPRLPLLLCLLPQPPLVSSASIRVSVSFDSIAEH